MDITLTQFVLPNGCQREATIEDMPEDLKPFLDAMKKNGCRLTVEVLTNGIVSYAVECKEVEADFDMELCQNGPGEHGTRASLEKLIRRFDANNLKEFIAEVTEAGS